MSKSISPNQEVQQLKCISTVKRAIEISKDSESSGGGLKVQLRESVGVDSVFDYQGVAKFAVEMCLQ